MKSNHVYICVMVLLLYVISGCEKRIDPIANDIFCPVAYSYTASPERTWNATVESIKEMSSIEVLDIQKGVIASTVSSVDCQEIGFLDQAFLKKTYTFSYIISFMPENAQSTRVSAEVKLFHEQFGSISRREDRMAKIENYLRNKLYKEICWRLFPQGNRKCNKGFDPRVKSAQKALNLAGYDSGPTDGLMGSKTIQSLKEFQKDNKLVGTGGLDNETYRMLVVIKPNEIQ